jgi:hypothetical protein
VNTVCVCLSFFLSFFLSFLLDEGVDPPLVADAVAIDRETSLHDGVVGRGQGGGRHREREEREAKGTCNQAKLEESDFRERAECLCFVFCALGWPHNRTFNTILINLGKLRQNTSNQKVCECYTLIVNTCSQVSGFARLGLFNVFESPESHGRNS